MPDNDTLYDEQFYEHESKTARTSAEKIVHILLDELVQAPKSVVDIGCGIGDFLHVFLENGIEKILGIDGAYVPLNKLAIPTYQFMKHDITKPLKLDQEFDLALCLEVAEHVEETYADILIKSLVDASPLILFSAAIPGQGGTNHVNEQWPEYWQTKFAKHGYQILDLIRPKLWREEKVSFWYKQNILLACKAEHISTSLKNGGLSSKIIPTIHDDVFICEIDKLKTKIEHLNNMYILEQKKNEKNNAIIDELKLTTTQQNNLISKMQISEQEKELELSNLKNSKSWKITRPLRTSRAFLRKNNQFYRLMISFLYSSYKHAPLSLHKKRKIADWLITHLPNITKDVMTERASARSEILSKIPFTPPIQQKTKHKLLIIDHRIPTPDKTSSSVRMFAMLEILAEENLDITFISNDELSGYHWVIEDVEKEIARYTKILENLSIKYLFGRDAAINHLITNGYEYSSVILCYPEICFYYSPLVSFLSPNAKLIYDTVDLHYIRFAREAEITNDKGILEKSEWYKKIEYSNLRSCDAAIAITEEEKNNCEAIVTNTPIMIVPNIHSIENNLDSIKPFEDRTGILFIGHYLHTPNEDAVIYLAHEIVPILNSLLGFEPDIFLLGSSITEPVKKLKNKQIHTIGYVADPSSYFNSARVFVAPLRYGAGMKGKIGQALSFGLPLVTTSIGAEGMQLSNRVNALIANEANSIAESVTELYTNNDLWTRLSENGIQHVAQKFSKKSARSELLKLIVDENRNQ